MLLLKTFCHLLKTPIRYALVLQTSGQIGTGLISDEEKRLISLTPEEGHWHCYSSFLQMPKYVNFRIIDLLPSLNISNRVILL